MVSSAGSLRATLAEARAFLSLPPTPLPANADSYDRMEAARRLWQRCRAIDGTHAEAYLRARGIDRCRFYQDGTIVGEVYRQEDILNPGAHYYVIHLSEDHRGPVKVHDRARIRETAQRLVDTHPLW